MCRVKRRGLDSDWDPGVLEVTGAALASFACSMGYAGTAFTLHGPQVAPQIMYQTSRPFP